MKWFLHFGLLCLLSAAAHGQTIAPSVEAQDLRVTAAPEKVSIEVLFSGTPPNPNATVATKPDRLVLEFPGVASRAPQQQVGVKQYGVKSVRIGPGARPDSVEVVVTLDKPLPYELSTQGNSVVLTVLPQPTNAHRNGPAPAASGPLVGALHRSQPAALPQSSPAEQAPAPHPPPSLPPIAFPEPSSAT